MSSTIVCRNFMSCFEYPQETNTTTTTLKLKVLDHHHQNPDHKQYNYLFQDKKDENNANANTSMMMMSNDHSTSATKPYSYNSFPRLSPKSLALCTENLGSETGTDTFSVNTTNTLDRHQERPSTNVPQKTNTARFQKSPYNGKTAVKKNTSFPPPLTTLSGTRSLQVTRHRENGRLIIEAVEKPLRNGVLHAERSGGRLRLCFLTPPTDGGEAAAEEEVERNETNNDTEDHHDEVAKGDVDGSVNYDNDKNNNIYQWLSRCKDEGTGDKRIIGDDSTWNKPAFWVVTS